MKRLFLILISFYQRYISLIKPRTCRFYPTCSDYTKRAIKKYGTLKGTYLGVRRLLHCHPFNPGGYDPLK